MSKKERTCEMCDHCIYIGEGDFICDRKKEPELVISDWIELEVMLSENGNVRGDVGYRAVRVQQQQ